MIRGLRRHSTLSIGLILAILVVSPYVTLPAHALGTVSATIVPPDVSIKYRLILSENATALTPASLVLDSSNSSTLVTLLQTAISQKLSSARLDPSSFHFEATIRQQNPGSNMWIISENLTGTISGVATGGTAEKPTFDLRFLAMNMSQPFLAGGFEWNNVGSAYLLSPILSQGRSTTFYLDRVLVRGGPYFNTVIPGNSTASFRLLDFSWVPKVSDWTYSYRPLDPTSSYSFNPKTTTPGLPYNLTMGVNSPEGTLLTALVAVYDPILEVTAPARATADGFTVTYDVSSVTDFVMPIVIILTLITMAVSLFYERRLSSSTAQYKRQDQRQKPRR